MGHPEPRGVPENEPEDDNYMANSPRGEPPRRSGLLLTPSQAAWPPCSLLSVLELHTGALPPDLTGEGREGTTMRLSERGGVIKRDLPSNCPTTSPPLSACLPGCCIKEQVLLAPSLWISRGPAFPPSFPFPLQSLILGMRLDHSGSWQYHAPLSLSDCPQPNRLRRR